MLSAVESVHRAQAAVEAFQPATCAKCGSVKQGHLRSHCDSVTGLRRTVAHVLAKHPELASMLDVIAVRSVDVCESSVVAVTVAMRVELRSDPWRIGADGRVTGTWLDVVCEYSDPAWFDDEPRRLIDFDTESWALVDAYGNDLPCFDGGDEWWLMRACMDHVAALEIERVREKALDWAEVE